MDVVPPPSNRNARGESRPAMTGVYVLAGVVALLVGVCGGGLAGLGVATVTQATSIVAMSSPGGAESDEGDATDADPEPEAIAAGKTAPGEFTDETTRVRFQVDVPVGACAMTVRATCETAPITVRAWFGMTDGDPVDENLDAARSQTLQLAEHSIESFTEGPLVIEVATDETIEGDSVGFTVSVDAIFAIAEPLITAAGEISGETNPASGFRRVFRVKVPADADVLRIDVVSADRDLDLFAEAAGPTRGTQEMPWSADGLMSLETLLVYADDEEGDGFGAGRLVSLTVTDPVCYDEPVKFRIRLSFAEDVPEELREVAALPAPSVPRDRALLGSVEVILADGGGSGTIVSGDGLVLTAAHVVEGIDPAAPGTGHDEPGELAPIVVAVTLDARTASVDLFRAVVVASDPDRDLALLRITQGLRGQLLPKGYRFPAPPVAPSFTLGLSDELVAVGYPAMGGVGSRNPLTASRGSFAGFDRGKRGIQGKTDALVSPGSSGGGAFDASWTLIGVVVSTIDDSGGNVLGFFVPIDEVPAAWRRQFAQ